MWSAVYLAVTFFPRPPEHGVIRGSWWARSRDRTLAPLAGVVRMRCFFIAHLCFCRSLHVLGPERALRVCRTRPLHTGSGNGHPRCSGRLIVVISANTLPSPWRAYIYPLAMRVPFSLAAALRGSCVCRICSRGPSTSPEGREAIRARAPSGDGAVMALALSWRAAHLSLRSPLGK